MNPEIGEPPAGKGAGKLQLGMSVLLRGMLLLVALDEQARSGFSYSPGMVVRLLAFGQCSIA